MESTEPSQALAPRRVYRPFSWSTLACLRAIQAAVGVVAAIIWRILEITLAASALSFSSWMLQVGVVVSMMMRSGRISWVCPMAFCAQSGPPSWKWTKLRLAVRRPVFGFPSPIQAHLRYWQQSAIEFSWSKYKTFWGVRMSQPRNGVPVATAIAMVYDKTDLPVPGDPARAIREPRGTKSGISHETGGSVPMTISATGRVGRAISRKTLTHLEALCQGITD